MDAWMENLPILKDFSPYQGRCPKRKKKEYHEVIIDTSKLGHRHKHGDVIVVANIVTSSLTRAQTQGKKQ